ncbi:DUF305 domain-containing protein [Micromonospora sp. PLK6-60]|uniref:DUF305 domain-containing protein n=1 Tax=Micromonospora sp. PLK6-60 TaxID=2873383 RepID=UPI001CA720BB|nr:DUF305 domain-containing protein [Micromonospora sp. PLK6-60]MBY8874740.1 DUF305 domain-containing protein [Micromonospora sp. PLK6-60]
MTGRRNRILAGVTVLGVLSAVGAAALWPRADDAPPQRAAATAAGPATTGPAVIVPGRPGEPAVTRPGREVAPTGEPAYNELDVWFVRMMIPHHRQALEMAELAPQRSTDPRILAVADRIRASQGPEVDVMRGWLQARRLSTDAPGHDHGSMRGMQSPDAMRRLAAARGAEFDRLFVRMMTAHHQGAVTMAVDLLKVGADLTLAQFANDVATEQGIEIDRMRELVAS